MADLLPVIWFVLIAVLWLGFLFLEGFDLGVGILMKTFARDERERRLLLNTIGPVWDGNEVWLVTAAGAMFAAFPLWYASLFSALYLPLTVMLLALILRAVAIEYRGKRGYSQRWVDGWTWCLSGGSLMTAFCVGVMLALTTTGLPVDANGDNTGGAFAWLTLPALIGGVGTVCFSVLHGLLFLTLKTDGDVRRRAHALAARWSPVLLLPLFGWAVLVQVQSDGGVIGWSLTGVAAVAAVYGRMRLRAGGETSAFLGQSAFLAAGVGGIFTTAFPVVLPSTLDPAFDLTIRTASSSEYTLGVMFGVAVVGVPAVLAYQVWSYSVFAKRLTVDHVPPAHTVPVAIRGHASLTS
ncbi:cytochrome d ubiquinol oxidase subunit II [Brevibacterium jeotgali]|uniref:Cytochrome d ubiquinol oxidase subunit II n=1 Tax=Brevibacterium jeotgali TaxID=1262550 RepID=A0A2H1L6Q9_9MICO|nr:cytochrome d ubiquinol oxidase subunit II [Brevibacterium jeotgali]TWC02676.1 cytochrome bd-I ubiquinol oxidase subunit 2 apoprotein [Brevibacterium jeotgali]SMY12586.1 cytochrome d ubiquinol oxidase subunit II [Brevibacterium jeotgali]